MLMTGWWFPMSMAWVSTPMGVWLRPNPTSVPLTTSAKWATFPRASGVQSGMDSSGGLSWNTRSFLPKTPELQCSSEPLSTWLKKRETLISQMVINSCRVCPKGNNIWTGQVKNPLKLQIPSHPIAIHANLAKQANRRCCENCKKCKLTFKAA